MGSREDKEAKLSKAIDDLLRAVGRYPGVHPELIDTPVRTAQLWLDDLLDGYNWHPADILSGGSTVSEGHQLVIVRNLFFHSTCPHHLVPYHGTAHIAYLPGKRIVGFSKIGRLLDSFAHRLIIQEDLGRSVADALVEHLGAKGAACMLDTEQLCMVIRGVRKPGSRAVTVSYSGELATDAPQRMEFLQVIGKDE